MNKNYMSEVAKLLGVNIGEEFIIQNADRKENVVLAMDGLRIPFPHGMAEMDDGRLLLKVLQGHYGIIKLPWKPKEDEPYWTISFEKNRYPFVESYIWNEDDIDFLKLKLGMVYRTQTEAKAHMAEDYERLTGKKLHENA